MRLQEKLEQLKSFDGYTERTLHLDWVVEDICRSLSNEQEIKLTFMEKECKDF